MILIVGVKGNMGLRYRKILDHIGVDWVGIDQGYEEKPLHYMIERVSGIIIASPTQKHLDHINYFSQFKVPILCEKPLTKNLEALKQTLAFVREDETPLNMVYQYKMLSHSKAGLESVYDYFKHGSDGLIWDCIQIIALARGPVFLREVSPIWRCRINGEVLSLDKMDWAYVEMIRDWLKNPGQDLNEIYDIHAKTKEFESCKAE